MLHPAWPAVCVYRIAHRLYRRGHRLSARFVSNLARSFTGVEIHAGADIGRRFFIDHGSGVVIGETAVIGDDVTLYQQVTLGAVGWWRDNLRPPGERRHPRLGDRVVVGANATLLGPLVVGDDAVVGAQTLLLHDVLRSQRVNAAVGRVVSRQSAEDESPSADDQPRHDRQPDESARNRDIQTPVLPHH